MEIKSKEMFALLLVLLLSGLIILEFYNIDLNNSIAESIDNGFGSFTPSVIDVNSSLEHLALVKNQQLILSEIQKLNLFSQCIIDTENISIREIPIDDSGGFRRVSIITLICPEILSER